MTEIPTFPLSPARQLQPCPADRLRNSLQRIHCSSPAVTSQFHVQNHRDASAGWRVGLGRCGHGSREGGGERGRHLLSTLFPRDRQSRPRTKEVKRRKQYLAGQYGYGLEWASITDWKKRKGVTLEIAFPHFVNINIALFTFHFISTTGSFIFNSLTLVDESAVFAPQAVTSGCVRWPPCTCSSLSFRLLRGSSDGASVFVAPRCSFVRKSM